jgi:putative Mg2+ transporter-C (MgtC) family protein
MSALDVVFNTLISEFSDMSDLESGVRVSTRLLLAALLGGLLGFERETHGHAAGIRTHMLVSLGAALFVIVALHSDFTEDSLSRVMQGIVAGVGFLCAGTIIKSDSLSQVRGLTTAAGIWFTAAMGMAAGTGHGSVAVLSTLLALFILHVIPHLLERSKIRSDDN